MHLFLFAYTCPLCHTRVDASNDASKQLIEAHEAAQVTALAESSHRHLFEVYDGNGKLICIGDPIARKKLGY